MYVKYREGNDIINNENPGNSDNSALCSRTNDKAERFLFIEGVSMSLYLFRGPCKNPQHTHMNFYA